MIRRLLACAILVACTGALPTSMERTTISKMRMADLETSASGYVYNQQQGHPASYVQYTDHGSGRYYQAPDTLHYILGAVAPVAPAVSDAQYEPVLAYAAPEQRNAPYVAHQPYAEDETAGYAVQQSSKYALPLETEKREPRAPYYEEPVKQEAVKSSEDAEKTSEDDGTTDEEKDDDDHSEDDDSEGDDEDSDEDEDEDDGDSGKGQSGSTEAASGKESSASEYHSNGEKGEKGHKSQHDFAKGEKGHYDNENSKGYYEEKGGHQKGESDVAGEYGSSYDEENSESGTEYGTKKHHNKGEKTNGYHNVYHKDEYKKDSDFYDDAHKEGHFEKYDSLNEKHRATEGGFKKGDNHYSGFEDAEKGKMGHFDKGHQISHGQGYRSKDGEDSYHDNHAEYAKEGSTSSGKKHGFSDDDGHH